MFSISNLPITAGVVVFVMAFARVIVGFSLRERRRSIVIERINKRLEANANAAQKVVLNDDEHRKLLLANGWKEEKSHIFTRPATFVLKSDDSGA